jgi:hypothetical protein
MKSESRIFDGKADGKSEAERFVFSIKTEYYLSGEQSSGSELGWFQTIPLRAGNRTNSLTDKDYFSHPVSLRVTPAEPLCWYRCWYGAGWSRTGLPVPTAPPDGIRSPPDRMRIYERTH